MLLQITNLNINSSSWSYIQKSTALIILILIFLLPPIWSYSSEGNNNLVSKLNLPPISIPVISPQTEDLYLSCLEVNLVNAEDYAGIGERMGSIGEMDRIYFAFNIHKTRAIKVKYCRYDPFDDNNRSYHEVIVEPSESKTIFSCNLYYCNNNIYMVRATFE